MTGGIGIVTQEVILMEKVEGLGEPGDIRSVTDGYARNYLFPRRLAEKLNPAARRRLEHVTALKVQKAREELDSARKTAQAIEQTSVTIPMAAGEDEKLFGSVTSGDIAAALKVQGIQVDRKQIQLEEPIHQLGVFPVPVQVQGEIRATLKVWVVPQ